MDVMELKEYILMHNLIEDILSSIGCHHIVRHGDYITCANKDGDNKQAIVVYLNTNLTVINYTRTISQTKRTTDIFDLVCYALNYTFPDALKYVCKTNGINYYTSNIIEKPKSLQIIKLLHEMQSARGIVDDTPLRIVDDKVLKYYKPYGNQLFLNDHVSLEIQREFNIGYDEKTNRITIPIRSPIGDLVGIKGRLFGQSEQIPKYLYLAECNKSKTLYGYWENKQYLKNAKQIYIFEAEKSVLQAATAGIRNCIATGGKTISKTQVELITRTGCSPIIAYDQDVHLDELVQIANMFISNLSVYAIIDTDNILSEKESPIDNIQKWQHLVQHNIYNLRKLDGH